MDLKGWIGGKLSLIVAVTVLLALSASAARAAGGSDDEDKGFSAYEEFRGSSSNLGQVLILDSSVGYDFNKYWGTDVGVPVYFIRPSTSMTSSTTTTTGTTGGTQWNNGLGDPYVDLRLTVLNPLVNYQSILTGTVPVADSTHGFGTGRVGVDWLNHFDHSFFFGLKPFVDVGLANGVLDTRFLTRPYRLGRPFRSLGFISDFEGGATYKVFPGVRVGASAYAIEPAGQQKIFSRLIRRGQNASGSPQHNQVFATQNETTGSADITRDNGFSAWVGLGLSRFFDATAGYNRSVRFAENAFIFSIGIDVKPLAKEIIKY